MTTLAIARWWRALAWWQPPAMLQTVIVNMTTERDAALRGVLWRTRGDWLVLREVTMLMKAGAATTVDGEVLVHQRTVSFIQVLDPLEPPDVRRR
jgi:hypothetical protein